MLSFSRASWETINSCSDRFERTAVWRDESDEQRIARPRRIISLITSIHSIIYRITRPTKFTRGVSNVSGVRRDIQNVSAWRILHSCSSRLATGLSIRTWIRLGFSQALFLSLKKVWEITLREKADWIQLKIVVIFDLNGTSNMQQSHHHWYCNGIS